MLVAQSEKTEKKCQDLGKKLKIGETEAKHTQNLLALKYKDKREVFMLSTMHKNEFANTNKRDKVTNLPIQKPSAVIDYNQKMGTVDQKDMLLSSIGCLRKSLKWYKKLFFHFIDTFLLNAYSLYLVNTGKRPSLAEFHINLIGQIIEKYHEARVQVHRGRPSTSEDRPLRLIERHFPSLVPPTERKKNPTRYCRVLGTLKGFDQTINVILDESHERVYRSSQGVEQVVLGLYIIRGDNVAVIGEVDDKRESELDFGSIKAEPLNPVVN
ncbi:hypothetical protein LAZ67_15001349 [Cordylochernes scorpioides]|uniref:Sm domain-containing protein n=1 Tax=Cordylochernes scorpioides TaxID=51811 RepID=A0ABY6L8Q4_9ARAC|nr:hypothetical protein LAZ67_15001349 [Cordylochernes scorpioides]